MFCWWGLDFNLCWWFGVLVLCFVVGLIANLDMASCLVALRVVFFGCLSFGFDWFCDLLQGGIWGWCCVSLVGL